MDEDPLPDIPMGSPWPRWKRLAAGIAACVAGVLTTILAVILLIALGSDDAPPGWVYAMLLIGVVAALGGLLATLRTLVPGRAGGMVLAGAVTTVLAVVLLVGVAPTPGWAYAVLLIGVVATLGGVLAALRALRSRRAGGR